MRIDPRIGVADSGHFDGFRLPLFYIRLVIRHFSKTAEDRSSADTAMLEAGGQKDQAPLP